MFAVLTAALLFFGQPAREGRLTITVIDQTGGVLPGAVVTVSGMDDGNRNGDNLTVNQFAGDQARYRINIIVQAQNLTNHANYIGYSGVLTSPFFSQPTAVNNLRRIDMGVLFNF